MKKISPNDYQLFLYKVLVILSLAGGAFVCALAGVFYASLILALTLAAGAGLFFSIRKNGVRMRYSREFIVVSILCFVFVTFFALFATPTVFSGRDQGSISEAAIRLSQNHKLFFATPASQAFFQLHEKGRALNFPGFYYTSNGSLITQFPLVYISWLALFFSLFGTTGFIVANAVALYFFLIAFYLLIRLFLETWPTLPTMLFTLTSFTFVWFSKYTLSENLALPLLWLSILSLVLFLQNSRRLYYFVLIASLTLLSFTRIEGFAFLIVASLFIFQNKQARNFFKENLLLRFWLPTGIFFLLLLANTFVDQNFYRELVKAMLPSTATAQPALGSINEQTLPDFYNTKVLFVYGLLSFFLFGGAAIVIQAAQKAYFKLLPFFVTMPTFIYIFDSHISSDHPWMLRRFMFSILPVTIFYSGLLIGSLLEKKSAQKNVLVWKLFAIFATIVLTIGNLPAFFYFSTYSENQNLLSQIQKISTDFSSNDLVLIDQQATGDGWTMMSEPMSALFGKNAVYFFNPNDLAKLDLEKFSNIYLITPGSQIPYYLSSPIGSRMSEFQDYSLDFSKLNIEQSTVKQKTKFPQKTDFFIQGKIFTITK